MDAVQEDMQVVVATPEKGQAVRKRQQNNPIKKKKKVNITTTREDITSCTYGGNEEYA